MYNYTAYVKRLNDKFKKQENTEIVDTTTPEDHPPQTLNNNTNETQPIQTPLNQNSFKITNNTEHHKAENMRDTMMLKKEEIKEAEMENFISDMLKDKNFIDLINKDSEKYESIIDRSNKAIIILGQEKEDLNLIANFLKDGELILESNEYGDWDFSKKSLTESSNILDSFYIKNEKYLTYKSSYLDAANSSSESTIDKFFLQKILSTTPTKFILAIKNIETKNSNSSLVKANLEKLVGIFEQFTKLLRYIDINEDNLSIVVTDSPASNNNTRISKIIDDTIKLGNFSDEQKIIINKIKGSIYLLPQASEQAKDYKDLLNITDDNYIIPDEYNKITIDGENLTYILNSINVIDKEILISINELKTYIEKKWEQNIESNLSFEDISAKTDKLKQLIDIVNYYKQLEDNAKL